MGTQRVEVTSLGTHSTFMPGLFPAGQESALYVSPSRAQVGSRSLNGNIILVWIEVPAGIISFPLKPGLFKEMALLGPFSGFTYCSLLKSRHCRTNQVISLEPRDRFGQRLASQGRFIHQSFYEGSSHPLMTYLGSLSASL